MQTGYPRSRIRPHRRHRFGYAEWAAIMDGRFSDVDTRWHGWEQFRTVIVGRSPAVARVLDDIDRVAATDSTVLLLGETGTGKELFATQIHERSARHGRSMVRVNCSAIPSTLMESELFGRERGAFTDAHARQIGRFELADHSSIFLDEIGELTPEIQVKLLRVLEERQFERLGSPKPIHLNTRVIAATHRNLELRIADGTFREDLFYRLNVFPIQRAAAARAHRGHPAAGLALRRGVLEDVRQADRERVAREPRGAAALRAGRATFASCAMPSSAR